MAGKSDPSRASDIPLAKPQKPTEEKSPAAWLIPAITAGFLAVAFFLYYFVYVSARREYLANRNFRSLALLGEQFQQSVSIHGNILDFCADLLAGRGQSGHLKTLGLESYLMVHHEDEDQDRKDQEQEALRDYLKYLAPTFELNEVPHGNSGGPGIRAERRGERWELVLRSFEHRQTAKDYQGSLKIDEVMKPLVASLPFNNILLVSQEGFVVYQSNQTGPQFTTLRALLQAQINAAAGKPEAPSSGEAPKPESVPTPDFGTVGLNTDPAWRSRSPHLVDLMLAGTRYKLFLQPVLVSTYLSAESRNEPASEWVLCGLRTSSALDWEALSLSYTFFIWFTAAFFLIWASHKALKIFFINHRQHLRLRELGALGFSLILLSSVITISLLQLDFHAHDDTEQHLQHLGTNLSANIQQELQSMSAQLTDWCEAVQTRGSKGDLLQVVDDHKEHIRNSPKDAERPLKGRPIQVTPRPDQYPFLGNAFWTDDDGHQIVKWSALQYVTQMIDISQSPVFGRPTFHLEDKDPAFQFASILPPNKLEYSATFSMRTKDCLALSRHGLDSTIKDRADIADGLAFLTTQPLSLIDPILPYGYSFAVVDQTGAVLFHSEKHRNGLENFLLESDGNKELYAALFSHSSPHAMSIRYRGNDSKALVLPVGVSQAPWSLVVLRDMTSFRTLNLQVVTLTSTLLLLVLAPPVIIVAIWCAVSRPRFVPEWLWPNRRRARTYVHQVYCYSLLAVSFLFLTLWAKTETILVACAVVPIAALCTTVWCIQAYAPERQKQPGKTAVITAGAAAGLSVLIIALPHFGHWVPFGPIVAAVSLLGVPRPLLPRAIARRQPANTSPQQAETSFAYRRYYLAAALLLLLLVGVLVPMALFRASLDTERRLAIKQSQLRLATAMAQRWTSIVKQHEAGEIGDAAWAALQGDKEPWKWIVPDSASSELSVAAHRESKNEHFCGWLCRLLYSFHHDYNDSSAEMLGVIGDKGNPSDWSWENHDTMLTLHWHGPHPLSQQVDPNDPLKTHDDLVIASAVPTFSRRDALTYAGIAVLALVPIGGLLWALAQRLFLFQIAPLRICGTRQVAEALREHRNMLILLPPVSQWQLEVPKATIDVREMKTVAAWNNVLPDLLSTAPNIVIELQHFEFCADDTAAAQMRFDVLQQLIKRENTQVAVVMTVPVSSEDYRSAFPDIEEVIDLRNEPLSWLQAYDGPAKELIWRECGPLPALWPLGAQLAKDLKAEPNSTEDTVTSEILERADPYYRLIWSECSRDQKFVLSQLASDGMLNPSNGRAIRQLIRRGLITKEPQFRIMNESFRRFLRSATTAQLKQEWLNDSRRSGWGRVHGAFFTTMTLLGVFLLATQNALWESAAAYVTTALGGLGTFSKLIELLRDKPASEKG